MTKQKVDGDDFRTLARLEGLQKALILTSANPVSIWRAQEGGAEWISYPGVWYDSIEGEGEESEQKAKETIQWRLNSCKSDVSKHFSYHKTCTNNFLKIDSALVLNDRSLLASACTALCEDTKSYSNIIKNHKRKLASKWFLEYPFCPQGHYFYVLNFDIMKVLNFNPHRTHEGLIGEIERIESDIAGIETRRARLPLITNIVEGAGFYSPDLQYNLETVSRLLE